MSESGNGKSGLREGADTILFMVLITAVFISAVALVHLLTRETIARNESLFLKRAVLRAAGLEVPAGPKRVEQIFRDRITESSPAAAGRFFHILEAPGGKIKAFVFIQQGAGLWGTIEAVVGFKRDLETLTGVDFTRQNETPGLGGRITEQWFRDQFQGKRGEFSLKPEGEPTALDEFDAITGATITSNAVKKILNTCVTRAKALRKTMLEGKDE